MVRLLYLIWLCFILMCFSVGCTYWYDPCKSFEACDQDLEACYSELKCFADMNEITNYEMDFMKDCMERKGYELVGEGKLPYGVRRRDPELVTFWLKAGVAGGL
jgi:hypothetical protein